MSNKNEPDIFEQMSIFQIMNLLDDPENTFSSEDISSNRPIRRKTERLARLL